MWLTIIKFLFIGSDTSTAAPEDKETTLPLETPQQGKKTTLPLFVGGVMGGIILLLLLVLVIAILVACRAASKTAKDRTSDSRSTSNHFVSFNG